VLLFADVQTREKAEASSGRNVVEPMLKPKTFNPDHLGSSMLRK
jgi:hypothetical protein